MSISVGLGEGKEVSLAQGTVHYRERGSGPAIVFVHGLLVNGDLWRKVVPELASDFRCITPDWPLGSQQVAMNPDADLSPPGIARIAAGFLDSLELNDVTLVGNDTGGALCQLIITDYSSRVGRLVLTNCDAYENFPPGAFRLMLPAARLPGAGFVLSRVVNWGLARRALWRFLTKRPVEPAILDSFTQPSVRSGAVLRDLMKTLTSASKPSRYTLTAAKKFGEFTKPVLIAWAPEDRFFTWKYAERLSKAFPNARLERIEDSLTFVPEDQPRLLAEVIRGFVKEETRQTIGKKAAKAEEEEP